MIVNDEVFTIIVTYNRAPLLKRCIDAIINQTAPPHHVLIVNNCSTDDTDKVIELAQAMSPAIQYLCLEKNIGGSGGFYEGMRFVRHINFSGWLWLMDDDASPEQDALSELIKHAEQQVDIYASAAVESRDGGSLLCWPAKMFSSDKGMIDITLYSELPARCKINCAPFLGFFVHTSIIDRIGLPEKDYFISGDDTEYSIRATQAGSDINLISSSVIRHPLPARIGIRFFGETIHLLIIPPWKRYYDTRNRILIAKKYFGTKLLTETLPGTFLRWILTLVYQKNRMKQTIAFLKGTIDGLKGKTGIRWTPGK